MHELHHWGLYSKTDCLGLDKFIHVRERLVTLMAVFQKCCIVNLVEIYFPAFEILHMQCVMFLAWSSSSVVLWGIKRFKAWLGRAVLPLEGPSVGLAPLNHTQHGPTDPCLLFRGNWRPLAGPWISPCSCTLLCLCMTDICIKKKPIGNNPRWDLVNIS